MNEPDDLKLIKKLYGEKMMHLCRTLFPSLLENTCLLLSEISKRQNQSYSTSSIELFIPDDYFPAVNSIKEEKRAN